MRRRADVQRASAAARAARGRAHSLHGAGRRARGRHDRCGDYVQVFRLGGASFESADDEQLNNWHERLNVLWRNLASPERRALDPCDPAARSAQRCRAGTGTGSPTRCAASYRERLAGETLMVNELYLAVVYRPVAGRRRAAGRSTAAQRAPAARPRTRELADALDACEKLAQTVCASLARYEPEPLGIYRVGARLVLRAARISGAA